MQTVGHWWGRHEIALDTSRYWQIGPLHLWIEHRMHEWHVQWEHGKDPLEAAVQVEAFHSNVQKPQNAQQPAKVAKFAFREASDALVFTPQLADRPVVTRLEVAMSILPGEEIMLYVSTPLWVKIEMHQPPKTLFELPCFRLSDTWFGPMSSDGLLCFASRTPAYLQLKDIPFRWHAVITPVLVRNLGTDSLLVDRFNLPLPQLSLFHSPRSGFWTDTVILERMPHSDLTSMTTDRKPPQEAAPTNFISHPRLSSDSKAVFRAFHQLFKERPTL